MAETKTLTGTRDDLIVDASRCLRMRFSESNCQKCFDNCPHNAVSFDQGLAINPQACRACLLCTSVCPAGALEQNDDFFACLAKLSRVSEPVLGCHRTKERSNAIVACLGGLSEEHLVTLCHTLTGNLTLNMSLCSACPNSPMITRLNQRLDALTEAELSSGTCCIHVAESAHEIQHRDESLDRRSFFKSFRTALFASAATILSASNQQTGRSTAYAGKRIPVKRELLNRVRNECSRELANRLRTHFDSYVEFDENCSKCQGCVAICPTGALKSEEFNETPVFEQLLCTGCGLCREFCPEGALRK